MGWQWQSSEGGWQDGNSDIEEGSGDLSEEVVNEASQAPLAAPALLPIPPPHPPYLDHLEQVCFEMISFLFILYAFKTWGHFNVFGGGPLTQLLQSEVVKTVDEEEEVRGRERRWRGGGRRSRSREEDSSLSEDPGVGRTPSPSLTARTVEEEEEEEGRSILVSSWSDGAEGGSEGRSEGGKDGTEEQTKEKHREDKIQYKEEGEYHIECSMKDAELVKDDMSESSGVDDNNSNITSELSDNLTFDDSACDDIEEEKKDIRLERKLRKDPLIEDFYRDNRLDENHFDEVRGPTEKIIIKNPIRGDDSSLDEVKKESVENRTEENSESINSFCQSNEDSYEKHSPKEIFRGNNTGKEILCENSSVEKSSSKEQKKQENCNRTCEEVKNITTDIKLEEDEKCHENNEDTSSCCERDSESGEFGESSDYITETPWYLEYTSQRYQLRMTKQS